LHWESLYVLLYINCKQIQIQKKKDLFTICRLRFFDRNEDGSLRVTIQGWGADEEIFAFVPLDDDSDEDGGEEYYEEGEEGERVPAFSVRKRNIFVLRWWGWDFP
jgi:hypothetical protein